MNGTGEIPTAQYEEIYSETDEIAGAGILKISEDLMIEETEQSEVLLAAAQVLVH